MGRVGALALVGAAVGCASGGGEAALRQVRPLPSHAGDGLSGERVMVLPVSALRGGDAVGWAASIASPRDFLADLNAQIARAIPARATHTTWILPADLARLASRNAGYAPDPYTLEVVQLSPDHWKAGRQLADPLAGQLRSLMSFADARYALVPVEVRFIPRPDAASAKKASGGGAGQGRALLRVALVDARLFSVMWAGDVAGDPAPGLTDGVGPNLAARLAEAVAVQ